MGRPVHLWLPCFRWDNATDSYNKGRPMGGVAMNGDLDALRTAFANAPAVDSPLPAWASFSAAASYPAGRLPAPVFLYQSHYVPIVYVKGFKPADVVEPSLSGWADHLPAIRQLHPLPEDNNALRAHLAALH